MDKLIIGIPSKGRLQENTQNVFLECGLKINRPGGSRNYRGEIEGFDDIQVNFLSASEIADQIATGNVHLGVTGEDLVREHILDLAHKAHLIIPLGFGHANVVIAIPSAWIDVRYMDDLADVAAQFRQNHGRPMRVATKYSQLTRRFFQAHNISDYLIVKSLGATEGAPAAGQAECIVDITSTGSTLSANQLRVLEDGEILSSQANLVASLSAKWNENQKQRLKMMLQRIDARQNALSYRLITILGDVQVTKLNESLLELGLTPLPQREGLINAPRIKVIKSNSIECAEKLSQSLNHEITIEAPQMIFSPHNHLFSTVEKVLEQVEMR